MWTCPMCNEQIENGIDSCWKCAGTAPPSVPPAKRQKPLEVFEFICLMIVALPGILLLTGGRVQNQAQAAFRISLFVVGLLGYIIIKTYQRKMMRGPSAVEQTKTSFLA